MMYAPLIANVVYIVVFGLSPVLDNFCQYCVMEPMRCYLSFYTMVTKCFSIVYHCLWIELCNASGDKKHVVDKM